MRMSPSLLNKALILARCIVHTGMVIQPFITKPYSAYVVSNQRHTYSNITITVSLISFLILYVVEHDRL